MKTICLDYDGTFTEFPELMNIIIDYCIKNKIRCILATMRYSHERDNELVKLERRIDVYYTERKAKSYFLATKGITPDIWIDDNPAYLYRDA